jgi:hypothetical protein
LDSLKRRIRNASPHAHEKCSDEAWRNHPIVEGAAAPPNHDRASNPIPKDGLAGPAGIRSTIPSNQGRCAATRAVMKQFLLYH